MALSERECRANGFDHATVIVTRERRVPLRAVTVYLGVYGERGTI